MSYTGSTGGGRVISKKPPMFQACAYLMDGIDLYADLATLSPLSPIMCLGLLERSPFSRRGVMDEASRFTFGRQVTVTTPVDTPRDGRQSPTEEPKLERKVKGPLFLSFSHLRRVFKSLVPSSPLSAVTH